jgi:hypothetical protein
MCATCHGPTNNGTGTPSIGMSASGTTAANCVLNYPYTGTAGTHGNGTVNRGGP